MEGLNLLRLLIESTGLPPQTVERELERILARSALKREELSLDDIRELLSNYLQEVLVEAKDHTDSQAI